MTSIWASNDWGLPTDFDMSPLEAFDYIMSDDFNAAPSFNFPMQI